MELKRLKDPHSTPQPKREDRSSTRFPEYLATCIEPCAIDNQGKSLPFHLLECGHTVVADCSDKRCGLNCLHVSTWMTEKNSQLQEDSIDIVPGKSLIQSLTSTSTSAVRLHDSIKPAQSSTQGHDKLFCETCVGIPFGSYDIAYNGHRFRRALGLTRPVVKHFTGYPYELMPFYMAPLLYNPQHKHFDPILTHVLLCGHEVISPRARPCAANCIALPACRGRVTPHNIKQGDAILCMECTYRAEQVYMRYITAGGGGAQEEVARHGILGPTHQDEHGNHAAGPTPQDEHGNHAAGSDMEWQPGNQEGDSGQGQQELEGALDEGTLALGADGYSGYIDMEEIRDLFSDFDGVERSGP